MALGACIAFRQGAVPLPIMDAVTVATEVALAVAGIFGGDELRVVLPAIYVSIGTSVCLIRPMTGAIVHMVAFVASYGAVLVFGPPVHAPLTRWLAVVASIVVAGTFVRWLVRRVIELATAEHQASREILETTQELSAQDEARTAFLAKMSHELRTPLNSVVGFAEVLQAQLDGPLDELQQELVADVADSGRDLLALVDDLLDARKVGEGQVELRLGPVDLCDAARTVERLLAGRAAAAGVTVRLRTPRCPLVARADGLRVRQVLWNLVGNAIKYSPRGEAVDVWVAEDGGIGRVVVVDRGPGIEPGEEERIFELYHQGAMAEPGSGIGLALCRRLSEAHGGTLRATRPTEGGSAFTVELPLSGPPREVDDLLEGQARAVLTEFDRAILIPGSAANRMAVARVGRQFARSMALLLPLFAAITPGPVAARVGVGALGLLSLGVARAMGTAAERAPRGLPPGVSDAWSLGGFAVISVAIVVLDPVQDVVVLAYGWPVLSAAALAARWRLAVHVLAAVAAYGIALAVSAPSDALQHWLALVMIVSTNAIVVRWVTGRLREAIIGVFEVRFVAESAQREVALVSRHKKDFLASTSHELLTPLNAVLGASAFLRDEHAGPLTDGQRAHLDDIHASGEVLRTLLVDMLDLAKLEDRRLPRLAERVEIGALGEAAVADVRPLADAQGIHLGIDVAQDVAAVRADPENLRRVLGILLVNGIRFTPPGGRVDLRARRERDQVLVCVCDTGVGIDPERLHKVFEPFHQGVRRPSAPSEGSSGLGLALARGLVALEDGDLRVESAPEVGSTFTIALPASPEG